MSGHRRQRGDTDSPSPGTAPATVRDDDPRQAGTVSMPAVREAYARRAAGMTAPLAASSQQPGARPAVLRERRPALPAFTPRAPKGYIHPSQRKAAFLHDLGMPVFAATARTLGWTGLHLPNAPVLAPGVIFDRDAWAAVFVDIARFTLDARAELDARESAWELEERRRDPDGYRLAALLSPAPVAEGMAA